MSGWGYVLDIKYSPDGIHRILFRKKIKEDKEKNYEITK